MNSLDLDDADRCRSFGRTLGELLLSSLRARSLDREYRELLREYDESLPLRMVFEGLLERLGAEVIERHPNLGLVVGVSNTESPLLDRVDREAQDADERRLMAVVLATMLALYYPADAIDDPTLAPRPLTLRDVHDKIRDALDDMRTAAASNGDTDSVALWEVVADHMGLEQTNGGRGYRKHTVAGQIERMFRRLRDRGLVTEARIEGGGNAYRPTLQMLSLLQNRLNHHLYLEISAALSRRGAAATP